MIKLTNSTVAYLIRLFALIAIKVSPTLKLRFETITDKISKANRNAFKLPDTLIYSVVNIEDKRYFEHSGIDFYAINRAIIKNIFTNRIEGGSTIVQQLVRVIINDHEIKAKRKLREIMLATLIDKEFSKIEIIFAYFETYRFGSFIGLSTLCNKEKYEISNLSLIESAQIAARLKYPIINKANYINYLKRVRTIEKINSNNNLETFKILN